MINRLQDAFCKSSYKYKASHLFKKKLWKLYKEKKSIQYQDRSVIEKYQEKKMRKLLMAAYTTPYYKKTIDTVKKPISNFTIADLKKFPILTKDIIRKEIKNLIVKNPIGLYPNSSGGSTGEPLTFYQDQNYKDHIWASMMIINEMSGWYWGARSARLWGAPRDRKAFSKKSKLFWQNTRFYDAFDMSDLKIEQFHKDMTRHEPEFIMASSSSIYLLASYLNAKGIIPSYPKISISTTSETLYPHMRKTIEDTFGVKCFNRYGGREVGAMACECKRHSGFHIFMDNVIVECIDPETGEEVYDKPGEIILTNLNNLGMPFIRYKVGDIGTLSKEKCTCGMQTILLKEILGRSMDHVILKNGKIVHGWYFNQYFFGIEGIKAYQFVQESLEKFTLYIVKMSNFNSISFELSLKKIRDFIGKDCKLDIHFIDSIPKAPSGKVQFIISKVDPEIIWNKNRNTAQMAANLTK
ncbi:MAG TPA: hypothetical protein DCS13_08950 [Candidatus Margulisbacteria bacterium]|nr:MAG: hypothetical protein A2X43_05165 [Candidatus Margulisbacteria bacterium GWD2_39_127]HAR63576.1 hypothetical protein [Candidatus Margulisiibacteriota bacterium]